jgi:hypothetical protein
VIDNVTTSSIAFLTTLNFLAVNIFEAPNLTPARQLSTPDDNRMI